ncbi:MULTISPECIES: acetate--CoA ligase family protein [unclassified Roseibium]|uniref:acetate--CoA ligase family protein n=1 Tax=unclassified Roseibium TaxID=2629323 RepID=UPI00273EBCE5|nr:MULTISPECIES: acetate--CoA ligase family protein [unclassified Roseibium]
MRSLNRLLNPRSIAVVGGGTWCESVLKQCRAFGYTGQLTAVHPKRSEVAGFPAIPSLDQLNEAPDAIFVGVNRHATIEVIREAAKLGAGGAVCFASGFREAAAELEDGANLQQELVAAAGDMPILGPNCYGFINALETASLWPDQHGLAKVSSGVAIISQSSNIALNLTMQARGLPIAYIMTVGNQAQSGLSHIGEALLDDDRVTAIGLHIEGIDDLPSFEAFARKAWSCGKPVVALKTGRSDQAQAATVSHTASIAGSSAGATALFDRLGIAEVQSLPVLLETLKLLHVHGPLKSARIASLSCSGGEASLMADLGLTHDVVFPDLTQTQSDALRKALGPKVALANPLDYHTYIWGDSDAMTATFAAMMAGDLALGLVVLDFPREDRCDGAEWEKVIGSIEAAANLSNKPMGIVSSLVEALPETIAVDLIDRGLVPFSGMEEALAAIAAASNMSPPPADNVFTSPPLTNPETLSEHEAKRQLEAFGIRVPKSASAASPQEAAEVAEHVGFPVVLKGQGIAHKSEAGAVVLNLNFQEDLQLAAEKMSVGTFLVEEMVTGAQAELLIGIVRDPGHGHVLTIAAGGVLTELLQDGVSLTVPAGRSEIEKALGRLKISKVLAGYRGRPACDLPKILDTIMALQDYVQSGTVEEAEINPLLCGRDFAIAADALIRCGQNHDG